MLNTHNTSFSMGQGVPDEEMMISTGAEPCRWEISVEWPVRTNGRGTKGGWERDTSTLSGALRR